MWLFSKLIVLFIFVQNINGFSVGAPTSACKSMIPNHGTAAQANPSGYEIKYTKKDMFKPGEKITVTLENINNQKPGFKGFIIEVSFLIKNLGAFICLLAYQKIFVKICLEIVNGFLFTNLEIFGEY